jgi:hypothetical protein
MLDIILDLLFLVEQPGSTLMGRHPRWRFLLDIFFGFIFSLRWAALVSIKHDVRVTFCNVLSCNSLGRCVIHIINKRQFWDYACAISLLVLHVLRFRMGAFGGTSDKATIVWSNSPRLLTELDIPFDRSEYQATVATSTRRCVADGRVAVTGSRDLKSTQLSAYS